MQTSLRIDRQLCRGGFRKGQDIEGDHLARRYFPIQRDEFGVRRLGRSGQSAGPRMRSKRARHPGAFGRDYDRGSEIALDSAL